MGPEFFQTQMGKTFYESTMKRLVDELKELNRNLSTKTKQEVIPAEYLSEYLSEGWNYVGSFQDKDATYVVVKMIS